MSRLVEHAREQLRIATYINDTRDIGYWERVLASNIRESQRDNAEKLAISSVNPMAQKYWAEQAAGTRPIGFDKRLLLVAR